MVRKQVEAGIDIVTDGEQGKESFFGYINDRFNGFELQPVPPGQERNPRAAGREYLAFPDYYAWSERIAASAGGRGGDRTHGVYTCTGPISYKGHAAVQADIATLKTALHGLSHEEVFLPAIAPSYIAATLPNAYYRSAEEYEQALCDALREEYHAIVDAGFILQIDDPRLVSYYMMHPELSVADCQRWAAQRVEAINDAIRNIPPEQVRFHTCYSIDVGPRIHEMAMQDKPRHQFIYTRADSSRLYWSDISPELSTRRFTHVQSVFCLCTAYLLVERRFLRHSRLHSAYM